MLDFPHFASDTPNHNDTTETGAPTHSTFSSDSSDIVDAPATPAYGQQRGVRSSDAALKRQRNTVAARKYRQKRLDRIKELEDALDAANRERDDLKLRLARQEAETAAWREMLKLKQ